MTSSAGSAPGGRRVRRRRGAVRARRRRRRRRRAGDPTTMRRRDDEDDDDVVVLSWWQHPVNVIGLVVAVALIGGHARVAGPRHEQPTSGGNAVDVGFLHDMRVHHEQAVQMALHLPRPGRHVTRPAHGRRQHPRRAEHRHRPDDPDAARHGPARGRRDRRGDGLDGDADDAGADAGHGHRGAARRSWPRRAGPRPTSCSSS